MRFADPLVLVLLPLVVGLVWHRHRSRRRPAVLYSDVAPLRALPRTTASRVKALLPVLQVLGLCALVLAMARPQAGREERVVQSEGVAIQLVIDRSGSMLAEDLDPDPNDLRRLTRLDVVRDVVRDFVDDGGELPGRPADALGLVSFGSYVQVHCPLTRDHEAYLKLVEGVAVPRRRDRELMHTAVGDALVTAVDRLSDVSADSKVVILLSDGESNTGEASPGVAAELARSEGVRVYPVGIGTVRQGLDEATLEEVAAVTGGRYFNARDAGGLRRIYADIDRLERTELPSVTYSHWDELFAPVLAAGIMLLLFHRVLEDTRFRTLP